MSTIKIIDVNVSGLNPNTKYRFKFTNNGGNWPVKVTPLSGIFYPNRIKTYVYFCSTTGECPPSDVNVFFNTPQTNITHPGLSIGSKSLYSVLGLSVTDYDNVNDIIYTHPCIVECDEGAPQLIIKTNAVSLNRTTGGSAKIISEVSGLIPNQTYTYVFNGAGGNWPVKIIPRSGTINSSDENIKIDSLLSFCSSSGSCSDNTNNVINYNNTESNIDREDLYSAIKLTIQPADTTLQSSSSSSFSVTCDDCLPKVRATLPDTKIINGLSSEAYSNFDARLENLIIGQEYSYNFSSPEANWPVLIQPKSGILTAYDSTVTLPIRLTFCPSVELCENNTDEVLEYVLNSPSEISFGLLDKRARVKLNVVQNSNDNSISSNELTVFCQNCNSTPRISIPNSIDLASGNDSEIFNATISNLIPYSHYRYIFQSTDSNWPVTISPMSGTIISTTSTSTISAKLSFCRSTGICPSSDPNVLDYTINAACAIKAGTISRNLKLKLIVDPVNYDAESAHSNEMFAYCDDCIPTLETSLPKNLTLNSSSSHVDIVANATNLIPGSKYSYEFKGFDSNWPSILHPMSGTITATLPNQTITSKLTFCPSTGSCPNGMINVVPYSLGSTYLMNLGIVDKTVKLRLELKDVDCNDSIANSNDCLISCDDCLPKTQAVLPTGITLILGNSSKNFDTILSNLIVGQEYSYKFNSINANWPVLIQPRSGTILATETVATIPTALTFCPSTGLCPNGNANILSYTVNNSSDITFGLSEKAATIKLTLNQSFNDKIIYSNESKISCNDCVARLKANIPDFMELTQIDSQNTFTAIINNLIPHSEYEYSFESIEANWPVVISPLSGTLIPTETSGLIPVKLSFCVSTGICPSSNPDILDYVIDPACITKIGYVDRSAKFRLMVDPINYDAETIYSNQMIASCKSCLKILDVSIPKSITLTSGTLNSVSITGNITNLVPGSYYDYEFKPEVSNWPSILHPMSGVIKADLRNMDIVTKLTFCPSTGAFPNGTPNVIPYVLDPLCSMNFSAVNKNVQLTLEVKEHDCHEQIAYSNDCRIFCDDCLKKLKIIQKTEDNLNTVGTKTYVLDSQLDNLVPGETYIYTISTVDGNWPVIVTKQSGEFIAQKNTKLIKTDIGFCYPSGLCAADTRDTMLGYRQNSLYNNSTKKFITLNMAVNQVTCANSITYSDDFTLNCNNCLPTTDYTVVFDNAPDSTILLPISCCSGNKLLSVNVSNAIPGDNHTYQFISASPDVVLSPSSGTVVFQSSGTAKLLTVATINLEQQNQAIVQFKLTNTSSILEAMSYVAIKCGPDCI